MQSALLVPEVLSVQPAAPTVVLEVEPNRGESEVELMHLPGLARESERDDEIEVVAVPKLVGFGEVEFPMISGITQISPISGISEISLLEEPADAAGSEKSGEMVETGETGETGKRAKKDCVGEDVQAKILAMEGGDDDEDDEEACKPKDNAATSPSMIDALDTQDDEEEEEEEDIEKSKNSDSSEDSDSSDSLGPDLSAIPI